ncbi:MAG: hypothetical protein RBT75_03880 [Anaerolineae bacterium]|jgi:hypothetical protein|nr:hypothetical protein [Anaerolineae bacterium]
MPRRFITENDIKDLVKRGVRSLEVNNDIVLTDLAREKARELGVTLLPNAGAAAAPSQEPASADLAQRIRNAVQARLGDQVDPALLDTIIKRVLTHTGLK